ncbi:MarR family transcriptional regulator [Clostridiales bacterium PH28_bin88]|nr:MarR family transcriptional regulator [Clostridiales bacterium PH28_bin88]
MWEATRNIVKKLGLSEKTVASCCGITFAQCYAIASIGRAEEISLNELAETLNLDNSTMSRTISNLVNDHLVERNINPEDRRYVTIRLTEPGYEAFKKIEGGMELYFQAVLGLIPEDKHEQVVESLTYLSEAMNKIVCC